MRIYDIFPPGEKKKEIEKERKEKKFNRIRFLPLLLFFILTVALFLSYQFRSLNLYLWPSYETFIKEYEILASFSAEKVNEKESLIPAINLKLEKELWQKFEATGEKIIEKKAKGIIRVYNEDKRAISLVSQTRFLSEEGKVFLSLAPIYIKGNSFKDVEVEAIEAGKEYNIKPSHFSIPGLKGSSRYFTTYGKSFKRMAGGIKEKIKIVEEKDINEGKKILVKKAILFLKEELKKKSENFLIPENAMKFEILEFFSAVKVKDEVSHFPLSLKGRLSGIGFKLADLKNLTRFFLFSEVPSESQIFENSFKFDWYAFSPDFEKGDLKIKVRGEVKIFKKFDFQKLKMKILSLSSQRAKEIILREIKPRKIKMIFSPFFIKKVPSDHQRIKIHILD